MQRACWNWRPASGCSCRGLARPTGLALIVFLIAILPSNIYAAIERVPFGGHEAGPAYLWVRVPFQLFVIGWIYWFAVRPTAG
jgi:uncharacterized membrane protein